jgi:hypothetical protein
MSTINGMIKYTNGHKINLPVEIRKEGTVWVADVSFRGAKFTARIDEEVIRAHINKITQANPTAVGSIFSDIGKAVRKIARSKAIKGALSAVSSVVKSPVFGMAVTLVPGIGQVAGPVLTAVNTANALLKATKSPHPVIRKKAALALTKIRRSAQNGDPKANKMLRILDVVDKTPALAELVQQAASPVVAPSEPISEAEEQGEGAEMMSAGSARRRINLSPMHKPGAAKIRAIVNNDQYRQRVTVTRAAGCNSAMAPIVNQSGQILGYAPFPS